MDQFIDVRWNVEYQIVFLLPQFPVMQVNVWLKEKDLLNVIHCEVSSHLLRNQSSQVRESRFYLAHVQQIKALVQVA